MWRGGDPFGTMSQWRGPTWKGNLRREGLGRTSLLPPKQEKTRLAEPRTEYPISIMLDIIDEECNDLWRIATCVLSLQ